MLTRLKHWWRSPRLGKSQRRSFVRIGRGRYKRLRYADALLAAEIERSLVAFGASPHLPQLVARHENELWVRFVDGEPVAEPCRESELTPFADFFAHLYARAPVQMPLADSGLPYRVESDLAFLDETGVLAAGDAGRLLHAAESLAPGTLWTGFDYVDPVLKNFVRTPKGTLVAVDVESLHRSRPLGTGLAHAAIHWPKSDVEALTAAAVNRGAPDFLAAWPYVRLCVLAGWTKRKLLQGKTRFIDPALFAPYLGRQCGHGGQ